MTQRRRFFPSTPVQKVPGQTVELEMRLQRLPVAAASQADGGDSGGGDDDLIGAGWFSPVFDRWTTWVWGLEPDGRWIVGDSYVESLWQGDAVGAGQPVPTADFRCVELTAWADIANGPGMQHVGILQGAAMSDVYWAAAWDSPSSADPAVAETTGSRFTTWGNVILVEQVNTGGSGIGGMEGTQTLSATAYSAGSPVGTLVLHCFHPAY